MRFKFRTFVILCGVALCGYALYPTIQFYRLSPAERLGGGERVERLRKRAMHLGLDLQGGIHLVLGIDEAEFRANLLGTLRRRLEKFLREEGLEPQEVRLEENRIVALLPAASAEHDWSRLSSHLELITSPSIEEANAASVRAVFPLDEEEFRKEVREASDRAMQIIRNRVDFYGVKEPIIQKAGEDRIVVELAGATDPGAAKELVGRTAQLLFHRVRSEVELARALAAVDSAVGGGLANLYRVDRNPQTGEPLPGGIYVPRENLTEVEALLSPARQAVAAEDRIALGFVERSRRTGEEIVPLYLLEKDPAMTGEDLVNAHVFFDPMTNAPAVAFELGPEGAAQMAELTGELLPENKPMAIVVDGRVVSAPQVKGRIRDRGQITGSFDVEEAKRLAVMLKAGNLPAPVVILEERTVGPSLGRDSIEKALRSGVAGFVAVAVVMLLWYRAGGLVASLALLLNIFFLVGLLSGFGATLTLPGIAGLLLTIGMAVDGNILIFERIREEARAGRPFRAAVEGGFAKAFSTIVDANLTTAIAGLFLYQFGTGPIRGFALTLLMGIGTSVFTVLYCSRYFFDLLLYKGVKRLPMGGGV